LQIRDEGEAEVGEVGVCGCAVARHALCLARLAALRIIFTLVQFDRVSVPQY